MRAVALIQARMGSRRFPQKMLVGLGGRPVLEWVLARVSMSKRLADVVLATTTYSQDDALVRLAQNMRIEVFRGSKNDVVGRFAAAARTFSADAIVRVCADNPFVDPKEIDRLIVNYTKKPCDYLCNHRNYLGSGYADGFGAEMFSRASLEKIQRSAKDERHREHVTLYITENPEKFRISTLSAPSSLAFPRMRFDVDTIEDLKYLQDLVEQGVRLKTPARKIVEIARSRKITKKPTKTRVS